MPTKDVVRARSVLGCLKVGKTEDGTGVKFFACQQTDLKIGFGLNMVAALLPKAMSEWSEKIRNYLKSQDG